MTRVVHTITPKTTLAEAWDAMQRHRIRHLPVVWDDVVAGMLSDRDLLLRGTLSAEGKMTFPQLDVSAAMTNHPITALPNATVSKLAALMVQHRIDSVPIVTPAGALTGLVTSTDLLELLMEPEQVSEVLPFNFNLRTPDETMAA
ncbi:MAG: HPP family protein [Myxococcota bacterium]